MSYTAYNHETYRSNIRKMNMREFTWEGQRLADLYENGEDDEDGKYFAWKEELNKRKGNL